MRIPEYVFAQLIGYFLQRIRETVDTSKLIDELFAFTSDEVIASVKKYIRTHKNIFVGVNWPQEDVHLPLITCINQGETEAQELAFLGDATGVSQFGTFGDVRTSVREARAIPMKCVTNIYIAAADDELTMFLYNIVRFIIVSNKDALSRLYDIHNLTFSGQSIQYDEQHHPTKGFYRVAQLSYMTLFDWNLSEEAAKIVSLDLMVTAQAGGVQVDSEVPSQ